LTPVSFRNGWLVLAALLLGGCEKQPVGSPRTDTGAEAVAKSFFTALVRNDWPAAYGALDPYSRRWCSQDQFVSRARAALKQIGFTPTEVNVAVTETGDQASAVAVYREAFAAGSKQYKDGTAMRRTGQIWAVVLRNNFGVVVPPPARESGRAKNG
jgi:hypothetical protein